jgi:hypothetical protein
VGAFRRRSGWDGEVICFAKLATKHPAALGMLTLCRAQERQLVTFRRKIPT